MRLFLKRSLLGVAALLATMLSFADPYEGFFTGGAPQVSGQQASEFVENKFHASGGEIEKLLESLTEAFNWQAAAMRLYGDDWFAADGATRDAWLQTLEEKLAIALSEKDIAAVEVLRVEEVQAGSEYKVVTQLPASGGSAKWEWILRTQGNDLEILDLQQAGQSLLKASPAS